MEFKLPQINGEDVARMIRTSQNTNSSTPIVAVTGYLKDLMQPHHFDALVEKPMTPPQLTEVLEKFCMWKPPPPEKPPLGERRESFSHKHRLDDSKDERIPPTVDKVISPRRGSTLGQMSSYTDDDSDAPARKAGPVTIPRSVKAEWDNPEPVTSNPNIASAKHLELPGAFMHRPSPAPALPSQTTPATASASIIPPFTSTTGQNFPTRVLTPSSLEKKSKRVSMEKNTASSADEQDADDELSKEKKPLKSRSISDFTTRNKRVSAEMKRSKSNISE